MSKTLTPSKEVVSDDQIEKLCAKVRVAAQKSGISRERFQNALAYPGTELEEDFLATLVRFSKKASGIITPTSARETGLVPDWCEEIEKDELEGEINLAKLDFSYCPVLEGEDWVGGDTMRTRAGAVGAFGSLGFGKIILELQEQGKDVVPPDVQVLILPRTILRDRDRYRNVPCLYRDGARLVLDFFWLDVFDRVDRLVRPRE